MRATHPSTELSEPPDAGFVRVATDSVRELRAAILGLASAPSALTSSNLRKSPVASALDKTLTWKEIARVVRDQQGTEAVLHMPGRRRMSMFVSGLNRAAHQPIWPRQF